MNEISENTLEFCVSEKEGMSKIVCDQLVKMISCCSTQKFLKRLLLLQELTSSWMNNDEICLVTVKKGVPTSGSEHLPEFITESDSKSYNSQQLSVMEKNISNGCDTPDMYCCEQCGSLFESVAQLKYHFESHQAVNLQKPPFKCGNCEKEFTRSESLRRHMTTHSGEKSYICRECGKRFSRVDHLTLHMRTHTGERPYKCNECGKQFGSGPRLKKHIGMHEKSRTPFICNCHGQAFLSIDAIRIHLQEMQNNQSDS